MKKDKKLDTETLGGRLKGLEAAYETSVESSKHIIVRCDGHKFSNFTKGFNKPFDEILSKAMELTTMDLVEEFNAATGYCQSDEITLIIPSYEDNTVDNRESTKHKLHKCVRENWNHAFSGRVQKMASLIAGFTTMKFNKHLKVLVEKEFEQFQDAQLYEIVMDKEYNYLIDIISKKVGNAWFDARVYGVGSDAEAFNSVLWRIRDAEKNSRSMFAQAYCSHKQLQKMTGKEQVEFCKAETGEDWEQVADRYKYGILVKKENYMKRLDSYDRAIAQSYGDGPGPKEVQRSRLTSWAQHMVFSDENVDLIMRKVK